MKVLHSSAHSKELFKGSPQQQDFRDSDRVAYILTNKYHLQIHIKQLHIQILYFPGADLAFHKWVYFSSEMQLLNNHALAYYSTIL